jgi:hypothetical protein
MHLERKKRVRNPHLLPAEIEQGSEVSLAVRCPLFMLSYGDYTLIFVSTRGLLKIKDRTCQQTAYQEFNGNFRIAHTKMLT